MTKSTFLGQNSRWRTHGFDLPPPKLIQIYLLNRKQRIKINLRYSSWKEVLFRILLGSILGPLLLNIFLCDLFWIMCKADFGSCAGDHKPYVSGDSINDFIKSLEDDSINLFKWFLDNQMKANCKKYHLITGKQSCKNLKIGIKILKTVPVKNC